MCVVMVSGLSVTEGVLLFEKESLLLCEGFTLSSAGDVCCRKHHPSRYSCVPLEQKRNERTLSYQLSQSQPLCPFLSLPV